MACAKEEVGGKVLTVTREGGFFGGCGQGIIEG